jgi:hypothetical protein
MQGFDDQKLKEKNQQKISLSCNLQQGQAFSPPKRTSSTSKN